MSENLEKNTEKRPPIVSILGHIDHGKSTLLDYIRKTNVVEKEAGGITQHISAYEVLYKREDGREEKITFLDTPGHEAFSTIRTRGANIADLAVIVVSAEDGPKPQTLEVYKHLKDKDFPFIVAITKIDKQNADIERTKQSLAEAGLYVEGYGGDISVVPISAKTGQGVEELLEMILLTSDLLDLRSEKDAMGKGFILESRLDPKRGISAVGVIKDGTVRRGLFAASGKSWTPLRLILTAENRTVDDLSFSSPIQIVGWNTLPRAGEEFLTFLTKEEALTYTDTQKSEPVTARSINITEEDRVIMPIIIKADTVGSLEAIENQIMQLGSERIVPRIISSGVGNVTESDVKLAVSTPLALLLGFHIKTDPSALSLADRSGVEIHSFDIVYELTDKLKEILSLREPKIEVEETSGAAKILKLFNTVKGKQVIGARVQSGNVALGSSFKIMRRDAEIGRGKIRELQQAKIAIKEVAEGAEFGAMVESKIEMVPGDILEVVRVVTK